MDESSLIDSAASKRMLFVGEDIIDVYRYVKPLGTPTKEVILSVEVEREEAFSGGVHAAANNVRSMVKRADVCPLGDIIAKTRYVERSHNRKLFQTYEKKGEHKYKVPLIEHDVLAVLDYGHGMFTEGLFRVLAGSKRYFAVNVQTNSGNFGFNLATKYSRFPFKLDYLVVDEKEARLATQNQRGPIEEVALALLRATSEKLVITMGREGACGITTGSLKLHHCPAFTDKVVDTMGAGDAFFAVTAAIAQDATLPQLLRIGNAAGALKSQILGHRESITKELLCEFLNRFS